VFPSKSWQVFSQGHSAALLQEPALAVVVAEAVAEAEAEAKAEAEAEAEATAEAASKSITGPPTVQVPGSFWP
jgi:hypothetical protein